MELEGDKTPARAFRRRNCRAFSNASNGWKARGAAPTKEPGSAWRWCGSWRKLHGGSVGVVSVEEQGEHVPTRCRFRSAVLDLSCRAVGCRGTPSQAVTALTPGKNPYRQGIVEGSVELGPSPQAGVRPRAIPTLRWKHQRRPRRAATRAGVAGGR